MTGIFTEVANIIAALMTADGFEISASLEGNGAWVFGFFVTLFGAIFMLLIYKLIPFLDRKLERSVMVTTYLLIAAIIFVEVFRRFLLNLQEPWSTTLPPLLFLIMSWFGCSYNIQLRTHLSFSEFRTALPRKGQMICLILDALLWFIFCWIVVVTSSKITASSASNFQILLGTDNVKQWWFLITVPIAFTLMATRVLENLIEDIQNYRSGTPLIKQAVIGAD